MTYKTINIKEKTEYKLIFIDAFYRKRLNELDEKKQKIILRELDIVKRLLNREPVTGAEYQTVMTRINDTVKNEQIFNAHLREIRGTDTNSKKTKGVKNA